MGRLVVIGILLATAILGATVYSTFKNSRGIRDSVILKLEADFKQYVSREAKADHLAVATLENTEIFGEQSAPVSFSYFINVKKAWGLQLHDKKIIVHSPGLEFDSPIAHFKGPEFKVDSKVLAERAIANQSAILEMARAHVSDFLTSWLVLQFPKEKGIELQVVFPGELVSK